MITLGLTPEPRAGAEVLAGPAKKDRTDTLRRILPVRNRDLSGIRLGPRQLSDHVILLRPPRFDDFTAWRRIRLRDQATIEPFWVSSELDWEARHTEKLWIRECLAQRKFGRIGRSLSLVIEVDGEFAGQCSLGALDRVAGTGEIGLWVDTKVARRGVGSLAIAMILDYGFAELGLSRITAPICVDNDPTVRGAKKMGLVQEAVMHEYFDAGGRRKDHGLWAALREFSPAEGFTERWLDLVGSARGGAPGGRESAPSTHERAAMPGTSRVLATVGRFYLGELLDVRHAPLHRGPLHLGPAGTPSVRLRQPKLSDYGAWRTNDLTHQAALDPNARQPLPPWTLARSRLAWGRQCVLARRAQSGLRLVAEVDGVLAGECRLDQVDMFRRDAELNVWFTPTHRDRAVAEVGIRLLVDYGFRQLGLHRIAAVCDSGDPNAAAIFAGAGLAREGTLHRHVDRYGHRGDHDLWGITATVGSDGRSCTGAPHLVVGEPRPCDETRPAAD